MEQTSDEILIKSGHIRYKVKVVEITDTDLMNEAMHGKCRYLIGNVIGAIKDETRAFVIDSNNKVVFEPRTV